LIIIVSSQFQPDDPVDFIATMTGGDDDRNIGSRPNLAQQVEAILLAEPQVENHQIRLARGKTANHFFSPGRGSGSDVVLHEIVDHQMSHGAVVLDNEDAGGLAAVGGNALVRSSKRLDTVVGKSNDLFADRLAAAVGRFNCSFHNHLQVLQHLSGSINHVIPDTEFE
jgi:hypothetical protein